MIIEEMTIPANDIFASKANNLILFLSLYVDNTMTVLPE